MIKKLDCYSSYLEFTTLSVVPQTPPAHFTHTPNISYFLFMAPLPSPEMLTASEQGHEDKKHFFKTGRGRWGNIRQKLGNSPKLLKKNLAEFLDSFSSSATSSRFFLIYTVYSSWLSLCLTKRYNSRGESSSETRVSYKGTVNRYFIIIHEQPAIIWLQLPIPNFFIF